ncbi:hypothetical protein GCM10023175_42150 [Pseudonocardia xishanensis]|uniref:Uncharacterized protein n=1 Tax=Pseudonocardia xishanensis TaxID=630995 RepID=A0ABP8RVG6_9PSEU
MAKYAVNDDAVDHARELIDKKRYAARSRGGDVQPPQPRTAPSTSRPIPGPSTAWHLGFTEGAQAKRPSAATPSCSATSRGSHRMGIIACHYRAAEWGRKDIELAAHDLLQHLDDSRR